MFWELGTHSQEHYWHVRACLSNKHMACIDRLLLRDRLRSPIQDNCTQYCKTENNRFLQCVLDLFETPPLYQFALCQVVGNGTSVTTSSSTKNGATPSAGTTVVEVSTTVSGNKDEPDATGSAAPSTEGSVKSSNSGF
jgi:hypothetical protein